MSATTTDLKNYTDENFLIPKFKNGLETYIQQRKQTFDGASLGSSTAQLTIDNFKGWLTNMTLRIGSKHCDKQLIVQQKLWLFKLKKNIYN